MKKAILIGTLASMVFSGCTSNAPASQPTPSPIVIELTIPVPEPSATSEPVVPQPTPVAPLADLTEIATYTNETLGFSFDYPAGWGVSDLPEIPYAAITIYSWDPNARPPKQQEGIPEGGEKMDVIAMEGSTLAEALEQIRSSASEPTSRRIVSEEQVTLPSGAPAVLVHYEPIENDVAVLALVTEHNGEAVALYGVGWSLDYFMAIAYSFRPAGQ